MSELLFTWQCMIPVLMVDTLSTREAIQWRLSDLHFHRLLRSGHRRRWSDPSLKTLRRNSGVHCLDLANSSTFVLSNQLWNIFATLCSIKTVLMLAIRTYFWSFFASSWTAFTTADVGVKMKNVGGLDKCSKKESSLAFFRTLHC